ncbi:MAG: hypothetical protein IJM59_06510 [Proteobacteria bacterium]|nr:hypothetical protein [Pseudomonadota bacterium]
MIQAFVSLKPQQPPRTESGIRNFFEDLQGAVFSQPTVFQTNADASVRPYSLDAVCEAVLQPNCKFVVLRAECEKFWQCTFLLPDKQGMGALFFDLQRRNAPRRLSPDTLIEMFKKLYNLMSPRLIRIGDSDAREKLKSRHGLVMMPGLGRIEWLQIVSPEIYGDIYNPSELIAAPGYQTDIWPDGALFMRVYDDPNDWDSEDNISQANFVPGFLAGVAKIRDNEKERETLRELERIWVRAEKTANNAYDVLDANIGTSNIQAAAKPAEMPKQEDAVPVAQNVAAEADDDKKRKVVFTRLKADYSLTEDNITKYSKEGPCTVFTVKTDKKPVFFATYQDLDRKVFILNALEDLSKFLSTNHCSVKAECFDEIKRLVKTYYHPEYKLLDSLDELPDSVIRDRRMPDMRKAFKPAAVENINGNQSLTFWFYKPEYCGLETLSFTQYEDWPMQLETKVQCSEMENEPEKPAETAKEPVKETAPEPKKAEVAEHKEEQKAEETKDQLPEKAEGDKVPAESEGMGGKIAIVIIVILIVVFVILYMTGNLTIKM